MCTRIIITAIITIFINLLLGDETRAGEGGRKQWRDRDLKKKKSKKTATLAPERRYRTNDFIFLFFPRIFFYVSTVL